jgi:molecular chaperone DnaK (HSP70)
MGLLLGRRATVCPFPLVRYSTPFIHTSFSVSVGDSAKNAFHSNPENTVFDAKRLIGRKMDDPEIVRDMKHWPFKVVEKNGKPAITVKHKGDFRHFVSAHLVRTRLFRPLK